MVSESLSEQPTVLWDRPMLERFKKKHEKMVRLLGRYDSFMFEGHEFVVSYAGYLIEYLESKLAK